MKILQVNCVYNTGSTGKIVYDVHKELMNDNIDSLVCYGRGKTIRENAVFKISNEYYSKFNNLISRFTGLMYGGCFFSTNQLISIIKKENPDIVHLHCINGYFINIYRIITWLKKHSVKTVLTLHAEFMHTANCGHAFECEKWKSGCGACPNLKKETLSWFFDKTALSWKKMKKAFDGFNENLIVTSVSEWLMNRAKHSPILADKRHVVVLNGLDTEIFKIRENSLREQLGILDEKVVLFVTPSFSLEKNHIKGGYFFVELARRMPEAKFVLIGNTSNVELPKNILNIGRVEGQQKLAEYYSMADLTVLTSKAETFSMVTAESLCCGTMVVGFKAGGPETITIPEYSEFVEYANIDVLESEVRRFLVTEIDRETLSKEAREKYSKRNMFESYYEVYKKFYEKLEG